MFAGMFEKLMGMVSFSFCRGRSMGITNGFGTGSPGIPKSRKTRERMREAALRRYAKPGEKKKTQAAVKKAFETIDRSGPNNGRFGKPVSEETKEKMRQRIAERGGVDGKNNPNFRHGRYSDC